MQHEFYEIKKHFVLLFKGFNDAKKKQKRSKKYP